MILPWASYNARSGSWTAIPACARPHCGLGLLLNCASAQFCMTVYEPDHVASTWNGTSFTVTNLAPVSGAYTKNSEGFTLAERWNGTKWQITRTLSPM